MRIKLSYFLSKRRLSLKKLCEKCGIKTHEDLESYLDRAGVEYPDRTITDFLKDREAVTSEAIKPKLIVKDPVLPLTESVSEISTVVSVKTKKKVSSPRKKTQRKKKPAKHTKKPTK